MLGNEKEIVVKIADSLAGNWNSKSRFREVLNICNQTLETVKDYRIFMRVAWAQDDLGDIESCLENYQQALENCPDEDEAKKSAILHNTAVVLVKQGQVDQAIALYQQVSEIDERTGDVLGKAATLHQMAGIYAQQGQVDQAIALFTQSMEIEERIGNVHGKAMTLWWLGHLAKQQGDFQTAISYLQESLTILQHLKSPDAATVQSWLEQVQQLAKSPPLQGG